MAILRDYLLEAVRTHAHRTALVVDGTTWTYAELADASARLAGHLQKVGVAAGSPVALLLGNRAEYVVADLALATIGAAKVPLNGMLSAEEQAFIIQDSGAEVCVVEAARLDAVEQARSLGADPSLVIVDAHGPGSWTEAVAHPAAFAPTSPADDDVALVMYTGGTTGRPKGVVHTQAGMAANLLSHLVEMELRGDDVLLLTSPLPHSAGFLLQAALAKGATTFLENRFDPGVTLDRIQRDGVTYLFLVPTMIYRLLDAAAARRGLTTSSLRTILYGAAPITLDRLAQGLELFGPVFVQLYAQSEAPNFLTRLRRDDHRTDTGHVQLLRSCGQPVVMAQVRVVRDDGGDCGPGEVGEVTARSPYTMTGYLGRPAETAEALRDGWLHTGDLGYVDEQGYLYLVDRKKDMIITGGLNVYSSEVEHVIAQLPGVREVAVAGIPHADWGEAVVAFVVAAAGVTVADVEAHCRARLTSYKRPKAVALVPALPTTAVGKIDKKALRAGWDGW
ncbi:long-chain acyl-CoA synthetase [Nocardioides terrae]|uniref:Long-chain acyl-CoA synthetase n=1 Tax=Nocardioides terrae TaxID=574651 RepID=A0A1I1F217_9ACTN|nr:AMP-binding protein [Nocardioides terrae]SFB93287.1 long-chain acyl-CoA synthetase [Nocardioides terrae]